jgi:hypothetical protein
MKAIKYLILGIGLIFASEAQAQLSVNLNVGTPPLWGPSGYSNVRYTDVIGEEAYNQKLSVKRANDVKTTLQNSISKLGTTGVTFEVTGLGENENAAPFGNKLPEERSYNRTVIIDIIPTKN